MRKGAVMQLGILAAMGGIALVDIVLSGDNALVIGAAAGKLPRSQRRLAIIWGGVGAVVMRLILAIAATELLGVPLLQAVGGVVLFGIAVRLLLPERENKRHHKTADRLSQAILTILVADATMSLDNVIAVGGLAAGNVPILVGGILFSMLLLFIASTIIARLMDYFTWLLDLASVVLAWTAATLVLGDPIVSAGLRTQDRLQLALHFYVVAAVVLIDLFLRAFRAHQEVRKLLNAAPEADPTASRTQPHHESTAEGAASHPSPLTGSAAKSSE